MEVWKTIKGFKDYEVSNLGNVKSLSNEFTRKERLLKKGTIKNGYNIVVLINDKNKKTKYVHRLVAEAFLENAKNNLCVNHINGVKNDNRVENLEWLSYSENSIHAFKNNLQPKGQDRKQSKLTDKEVLEIRGSDLRNVELSRLYNISKSTISGIQSGKLWKHIN
jgi:hypothetical protein